MCVRFLFIRFFNGWFLIFTKRGFLPVFSFYGEKITNYELRITNYELRITNYEFVLSV